MVRYRSVLPALLFCLLTWSQAGAQPTAAAPERMDVWDIDLGTRAADIPDEFIEIRCGTNGGPPSIPLDGFSDFARCKPEPNGLHEVYFEFDDELEYWARALAQEVLVRRYRGTQVYDYPVVASLLLDDGGVVRGIRLVTDPRANYRDRNEFWTMANFLRQRFGIEGWECGDLPRAPGETSAGSYFIKDRCTKRAGGQTFILERRYYQKKGQTFINRYTGEVQPSYFESETRFEVYDDSVDIADAAAN